MKSKAIITGAAGGMGRACARLFGASHDLVLTDLAQEPLDAFAQDLCNEGAVVVSARAGDLDRPELIDALLADLGDQAPVVLVHTAGLSPTLGDWKSIMRVNLVATVKLLDAIEPHLRPGSVAIMIASIAGHASPLPADRRSLLDAPLAPDFLERIAPLIEQLAAGPLGNDRMVSYSLSKEAVIRLAERRAGTWAKRQSRIVSLSPGLITTPMGRREVAEPAAAQVLEMTPLGRMGSAMEIAFAARFLASDEAAFITGTDLRIDGGMIGAQRGNVG